ncbi:hypothetical protein [Vibrio owensii]|uniref:hypothetical protein n=1 Tax=Vibrio harveyi group TaxID=717610 RepID=UPI003CC612ED
MSTKSSFIAILLIFITVGAPIYWLSTSEQLKQYQDEVKGLSFKAEGYIFTSKNECKKHEHMLNTNCKSIFEIAETKSREIGRKIKGLATCKNFYDIACKQGVHGYTEPTPVGVFYLSSQVPQIAPLFFSAKQNSVVLPSGCILKRSDSVFEFDGKKITSFAFLNWVDQERTIRVPSGKTSRTYVLHKYIKRNKHQNLERRMKSCLGFL